MEQLEAIACWEDLFALPRFKRQLSGEVMKTGTTVKPYAMSRDKAKEQCGIIECGTKHFDGYVVRLPNGDLSHVGGHCGKKHFGAVAWKAQMRTLRQSEKAASAAAAVREARALALAYAEEARAQPSELREVQRILELFDTIPSELKSQLVERALRKQEVISQTREPTQAEIAQAKFYEKPRPRASVVVVGQLKGLAAIATHSRADAVWVRLQRHLDELAASASAPDATAHDLGTRLRQATITRALLDTAIDRAKLFFSPVNLAEVSKLSGGNALRQALSNDSART